MFSIGGELKSRLFCRQSDPTALFRGLHTVEAASRRLAGVARALADLADPRGTGDEHSDGPESTELDAETLNPAAMNSETLNADNLDSEALRGCLESIRLAVQELDACAGALEAATAPVVSEGRWNAAGQEHYPELVSIGTPPSSWAGAASGDVTADLARYRLLVSSVKDRYTTTVPSLPWIGPERDAFCGPRLTAFRASLERAEELLRDCSGSTVGTAGAVCVDLTDEPEPEVPAAAG